MRFREPLFVGCMRTQTNTHGGITVAQIVTTGWYWLVADELPGNVVAAAAAVEGRRAAVAPRKSVDCVTSPTPKKTFCTGALCLVGRPPGLGFSLVDALDPPTQPPQPSTREPKFRPDTRRGLPPLPSPLTCTLSPCLRATATAIATKTKNNACPKSRYR